MTLRASSNDHYGTAAQLAADNPLLERGQVYFETDTGKIKIGTTGATRYNDESYAGGTSGASGLGLSLVEIPISIDPLDWTLNDWTIVAGIATPPANPDPATLELPAEALAYMAAMVLVVPINLTGEDDEFHVWVGGDPGSTNLQSGPGVAIGTGDATYYLDCTGDEDSTSGGTAPASDVTLGSVTIGAAGTVYADGVPYLTKSASGAPSAVFTGPPLLILTGGTGDGGSIDLNNLRLLVATLPA